MKTMKLGLLAGIGILLCLSISCKKSKDEPFTGISGYWTGAYGRGNANPDIVMSVVIRENGTNRVYYGYYGDDTTSAVYKREGHFTYENEVLLFDYTEYSSEFIHKATVNSNSMSGSWGYAPSVSDGGKFYLNKKK